MSALPITQDFALPSKWRAPLDLGFSVIPIERGGKLPLGKWKAAQSTAASLETVRQWAARDCNVGIVTGKVSGLLVLDLDSQEAVAEAEARGLPHTISVRTAKGLHVYFRHPGGTIGNRAGLLPGWDIRGDGGFVVAPGSIHPTGIEYRWENPPGLFELAEPPTWLMDLLAQAESPVPDNVRPIKPAMAWAEAALRGELGVLMAAPAGERNKYLNISAMKMAQLVAGDHLNSDEVKTRLRATAAAIGLDPAEIDPTIESGFRKGLTEPRDPPDRHVQLRQNVTIEREPFDPATGEVLDTGAEPSEDAIALAFTAQFRDLLRFDHDAGRWFRWDGSRWQRNGTDLAFHYARQLGRNLGDGKRAMCRASVAAGAERFARADPAHAVESTAWDAHPMLLSTPGCTADLTTGRLRQPDPADLITKQTTVTPEPGAPELWLRFLTEALNGDLEAVRFLQQWFGYCLTGDTRDHALLFLHGMAGTGKTVFLNTLKAILGDYAVTAAMETFTASKYERHSTELAMLRGARLVTASETEEGRRWAEARIKQMTGGDPITARFMRQDNFTFQPQFKLTIVGNHAPRLTNPDDAMRRRFNILGFNVKPATPDLLLEKKLQAEHGRILQWAIDGCLDWQANGLVRPAVVTAATADYFEGEDLLGQWLAERCNLGAGKFEIPARLYRDWQQYAEASGEHPGTAIAFGKKLKKLNIENKSSNGLRAYRGVELRAIQGCDHDF